MKVSFNIADKSFEIKAYNTFTEKELLLMSSFGETDLEKALRVLEFEADHDLSEDEMKAILYKHREVSIGDEVNVKFKCDNCTSGSDGVLSASNFVIEPKRNDSDVKKLMKKVTDENLCDFVDIDVDELYVDEFEELKHRVIENQVKFDFIKSCNCLRCGHPKKFNMGEPSYIIEIMSEDTLMTLYKSYNHLTFFGNYTKQDIDSMYPFERTIFIGLLDKTKEDLGK
jgi:hypothetical protein